MVFQNFVRNASLANLGLAYWTHLALLPLTLYGVYWQLAPVLTPYTYWWETDCGLGSGTFIMLLVVGVLLPALAVLGVTGIIHLLGVKALRADKVRGLSGQPLVIWGPWMAAAAEVAVFWGPVAWPTCLGDCPSYGDTTRIGRATHSRLDQPLC
ncbi:MAG: hypothetical protein R3E66_17610 [bacterium]